MKEHCEHCGSDKIYHGPPDCPNCGAPNCCQTCCKIASLEKEVLTRGMEIAASIETNLSLKNDITNLHSTLRRAIEIIKTHVPDDALGMNDNGGEPVAQSWPLKEEELYYMEQAIALTRCE